MQQLTGAWRLWWLRQTVPCHTLTTHGLKAAGPPHLSIHGIRCLLNRTTGPGARSVGSSQSHPIWTVSRCGALMVPFVHTTDSYISLISTHYLFAQSNIFLNDGKASIFVAWSFSWLQAAQKSMSPLSWVFPAKLHTRCSSIFSCQELVHIFCTS